MKKLLLAASAIVVVAGSANAADMRAPVYKAAAPVSAYNWTGFYLGVNAGIGVGRNESSLVQPGIPTSETFTLAPVGAIGGVQAGYNWQFGNWILGLEADIQASGKKDNDNCLTLCRTGASILVEQSMDWFGTVRGRIGYAHGPIMAYYTGGLAYGSFKTSIAESVGAVVGNASFSETVTGYTLGSGIEASLGGNWTGKVEYLFVDLGDSDFNYTLLVPHSFTGDIRSHIIRAGLNYRIGGTPAAASYPTANWMGLYIGANVGSGYARNENSLAVASAPPSAERYVTTSGGFLGGVQAGYNWQASNLVFGIEVDFQGSTQKDDQTCLILCVVPTQFARVEHSMPWFGTVRGRVGYAAGPALLYLTGGLAYGKVETDISEAIGGVTGTFRFAETKTGWTVGAGMERPFDLFGLFGPNWTAKTEYLYIDLGSTTHAYTHVGLGHVVASDVTNHVFRAGLNYHFNAAPLATKY